MNFSDHFSDHSEQYSAFRPSYPDSLFSLLASLCAECHLALDCATGSGQAAISLVKHFDSVIATDASANQLANAAKVNGVTYAVAPAEHSGIPSASIDLLTAAQALHWFDIRAFSAEADRLLKNRGILAVWTYGLLAVGENLNEVIEYFYDGIVGDYWPFERKIVESGYSEIQMPFEKIPTGPMQMTAAWKFSDLIGYLNTWSAVKAYEKQNKQNPLELVHADLQQRWGDAEKTRVATWPLIVKIWRKTHD